MNEWLRKKKDVSEYDCLFLEMKDKNGVEYQDGSIVGLERDSIIIYGYIRYLFGRFEVVCPFINQRFIYGLNPNYEIVGHWFLDNSLIKNQEKVAY